MQNKIILSISLLLILTACSPSQTATLTVMTHDSFSISEGVITAFEQANQVDVIFLRSGDAGELLNKAILLKDAPLADVLYGVDNTFLSRALEADIFLPYVSLFLANTPEEYRLDDSNRLLPVDFGDVCINYDREWFHEHALPVPTSLEDLTRPDYGNLLVVENPATSSPGLAFLLATIAHFGDPGYLDFWEALRQNGVVVADGWETAYYTHFSASSGAGPQPMVVSYASSPAAEFFYAEQNLSESPTASILTPDTCFRQVEFAGILRGGNGNETLAMKFLDFMLDIPFQEDIPLQMFVFPVNPDAALPEVFTTFARIPSQPAQISPEDISSNRERWIQAWMEVVIR